MLPGKGNSVAASLHPQQAQEIWNRLYKFHSELCQTGGGGLWDETLKVGEFGILFAEFVSRPMNTEATRFYRGNCQGNAIEVGMFIHARLGLAPVPFMEAALC